MQASSGPCSRDGPCWSRARAPGSGSTRAWRRQVRLSPPRCSPSPFHTSAPVVTSNYPKGDRGKARVLGRGAAFPLVRQPLASVGGCSRTSKRRVRSDWPDVDGLGSPVAGLDVIADLGALGERPEAAAVDAAVMDEEILPGVVGGDEAVALVVAEPLDGSCCHAFLHWLCAADAEDAKRRLRALALLCRPIARPNGPHATRVAPSSLRDVSTVGCCAPHIPCGENRSGSSEEQV